MNPQLTCSQRQWLHSSVSRASHRYRGVMGSSHVEVLNFFQASLRNCINCVHCDDHFFIFMSLFWLVKSPINSALKESGIEAESFESWCSWFLSFSPQWFITPARIIFQIHDSQRLLITYWLDDFRSGNLVLFCIVSLVFKFLLQTRCVSSFLLSRYGVFLQLNINHQSYRRNKRECTNYIRGSGGDATLEKNFQNWTLGNAHLLSLKIECN